MGYKTKVEPLSYEVKFNEAVKKFPDVDTRRLKLRVSPLAYYRVSCFWTFTVFDRYPWKTYDEPLSLKGLADGIQVHLVDDLANGLAELVDLDTNDAVTMDFSD